MIEACCQLDVHGQLAGIIIEPAAPHRWAAVLVSAGLVPKFGPYRLYAELARRLARDGFFTLRFDLGDVGDSRQAHVGQPLEERTRLEIGAAVGHVNARQGIEGVVLAGLCSGAEDSFRYAENDPRIGAVVLVDPFSYRTSGWTWRHAVHRLMRRSMRLLRLYQPLEYRSGAARLGNTVGPSRLTYQRMPHAESSRILKVLLDRGVHVHFVYTGGSGESFNHTGQLQAMFPGIDFKGLVTVDHLPHIDHTQPLQQDRDCLVDVIGRRLLPLARRTARRHALSLQSSAI